MSTRKEPAKARTFFLNETHELTSVEKGGGGRIPDYTGIAWASKGKRISQSLAQIAQTVQASQDPLKGERYFVIAQPVPKLKKRSDDKKKAPQGTYEDPTDFGGVHGRVFDRLGLDLLQVTDDGRAVVHAEREKLEQLRQRSASLSSLGAREQARWATIDSFDTIPFQLRVDAEWLQGMKPNGIEDVVFELQPVLTRVDADLVLHAISDMLLARPGEKLTGTGTDFSGRYWFRGKAAQRSVRAIAKDFFSVQSVHSPLYSIAAMASGKVRPATAQKASVGVLPDPRELPCVAVVDLGVPSDHKQLAYYRRGQFFPQDAPQAPIGDHGSFVASRVVFGECESDEDISSRVGTCSFYDAMVGDYPDGSGSLNRVNDKIVMEALRGVRGSAPDVRVFNLSFGDEYPLLQFPDVKQREKRLSVQDLDNFIFANDVLVVVAAGNSAPGVPPNASYPNHHTDPRWALGPWACGYNTLVCGSYVGRLTTHGLVKTPGWPSPFTRIGPGFSNAPVPSFAADGGNTDAAYGWKSGLGVWGFSGRGLPEDRIGTSHAAPVLAREAARLLHRLQEYCLPGTQPYAITARAFLALTAHKSTTDAGVAELAERTLGLGKASADRLVTPMGGSAVMLWQGLVESAKDVVRVQLPVPLAWLAAASAPVLRLAICYDPPVNATAQATWACRKARVVVHLGPEEPWLRAPAAQHETYPLIIREYNLARNAPGQEREAKNDLWLLEISYEEVFSYPPGMDFDPRQRIAFAAELIDRGSAPVDPQPAMQALPIAASMDRLSIQAVALRSPVIVRSRR